MNKLTSRVADYCKKMSGQELQIETLSRQLLGKLPVAITGAYSCYGAVLMGVPVILLEVRNNDSTPKQLQKHQQLVTRHIGQHAVFVMDSIASYRISRMIEARVNFIIPDKLLYVPSLMLNLKEVKDGRNLDDEMMPGMAQCVLLYHLQREDLNGWTTRNLAEKFCTSYASMNRALRWLKLKELVNFDGIKEKALVVPEKRKYLWEKALPLMVSPVERMLYTDEDLVMQPMAGESGLEYYTMIATPERLCRAVSKRWAQEKNALLNKYDGETMVEIWRYDPSLLAINGVVDPLSLYLCMRTSDDERIRIELKNLMGSIEWLED